jgi:hypothetical protein
MKNMKKAKVCLLLMIPKVGLWRKKMERFAVPKNVNQFSVQYNNFSKANHLKSIHKVRDHKRQAKFDFRLSTSYVL